MKVSAGLTKQKRELSAVQHVAALVTDLIFATKIQSTAREVGAAVKVVRSIEKLQERLNSGADSLVIVDLNAEGIDVIDAIKLCRAAAHRPRTMAYASHVQADLIGAARAAGADEVMARSAFAARLPDLLAMTRGE